MATGIDWGPLPEFEQFARDGLLNAGFLFQAMSGQLAGGTDALDPSNPVHALAYITILLTLIGGFILLLNRKLHTPTHILSWMFLVLVCVTGPVISRGSEPDGTVLFKFVDDSRPGVQFIGYRPQVAIIDFMSKMHNAVYISLFSYEGNGKSSVRNFMSALTGGSNAGVIPDANFNNDVGLKNMMSAYDYMCSSNIQGSSPFHPIIHPLENHNAKKAVETLQGSDQWRYLAQDLRVDMGAESSLKLTEKALQGHAFSLKSTSDFIEAHSRINAQGMPPFAVMYDVKSVNDVKEIYSEAGITLDNQSAAAIKSRSETIVKKEGDLTYLLGSYKSAYGGNRARGNRTTKKLFHEDYTQTFTFSNDTTSHDFTLGTRPFKNHGAFGYDAADNVSNIPVSYHHTDAVPIKPAQERLESIRGDYPNEDERKALDDLFKDANNVPVGLGFILEPGFDVLAAVARAKHSNDENIAPEFSWGGTSNFFISLITDVFDMDLPYRYTVATSCLQLHHLINQEVASKAVFYSGIPSAVLNKRRFAEDIATDLEGNISYSYDHVDKALAGKSKLNGNLGTYYKYIREAISSWRAPVPSSTTGETVHIISPGGSDSGLTTHGEAALELLRQRLLSIIARTTMEQTRLGPIEITPVSTLDNAISSQISSENISSKFNTGAQWLGAIGGALDGVGAWWKANFEGAEAIVYTMWIMKLTALALFLALLATPMLYLIGLVNPSQAPGIIINSLLLVFVLKMVPITFTLIDFAVSYTMQSSAMFGAKSSELFGLVDVEVNQAIMVFVIAGAYSSVVLATLFLLFKAGDTSTIMGQLGNLDSKANDIAKQSVDAAETVAKAGVAIAGIAAGGAVAGGLGIAKAGIGAAKATQGGVMAKTGAAFKGAVTQAPEALMSHTGSAILSSGKRALQGVSELQPGRGDGFTAGAKEAGTSLMGANARSHVDNHLRKTHKDTGEGPRNIFHAELMGSSQDRIDEHMKTAQRGYDRTAYQKAEKTGFSQTDMMASNTSGEKNKRLDEKGEAEGFKRFEKILEETNKELGLEGDAKITADSIRLDLAEGKLAKEFSGKLATVMASNEVAQKLAGDGDIDSGKAALDQAIFSKQNRVTKKALYRETQQKDAFGEFSQEEEKDKMLEIGASLSGAEKNIADGGEYEETYTDTNGNVKTRKSKPKPESTVDQAGSIIKDFAVEASGLPKESINNTAIKNAAEKQSAIAMGKIRNGTAGVDVKASIEDLARNDTDFAMAYGALSPEVRGRIESNTTGFVIKASDEGYESMKEYLTKKSGLGIKKGKFDSLSSDEMFASTDTGKAYFKKEAELAKDRYKEAHDDINNKRKTG